MVCDVPVDVQFENGMPAKDRQEVVMHLNKCVSDEFVLFAKLFKYHWNVRGQNFKPLHSFFEELYEKAQDNFDLLAERVRALGEVSVGTMKEFLELTHLTEEAGRNPTETEMIGDLVKDYQIIIQHLRKDIAVIEKLDPVTANMLMTLVEQHEKSAWMLRSHLECPRSVK